MHNMNNIIKLIAYVVKGNRPTYIGLTDNDVEGVWTTFRGDVISWTFWKSGDSIYSLL